MKKQTKGLIVYLIVGALTGGMLFWAFGELTEVIFTSRKSFVWDEIILKKVQAIYFPGILPLMKGITFLGSIGFYMMLVPVISYFFYLKRRYDSLTAFLGSFIGASVLNYVLKLHYLRLRPTLYFKISESGYSFPSGHAMISMAVYGMFFYLLAKNNFPLPKILLLILGIGFPLLIGFSRIYLGVHWPTDVLGGFIAGLFWLIVTIIITEILFWKKR
ncbi:phosphatase PAP2 family protein [Carboxydothermus islandicus]|uniref:phosphatase PAP2 family protein n=1 Tax=Carboxydothermus islandicus TaxID=661089 RepID=UPI00096AC9DD|nr:phosphatase PAP2 family protein [Carboxydothermus islandicus]